MPGAPRSPPDGAGVALPAAWTKPEAPQRQWRDRLLRRIVEVFVKDVRRAAYPVVLSAFDRPADAEFIEQVVKRMRLGAYSAEETRIAKFLVREADRA